MTEEQNKNSTNKNNLAQKDMGTISRGKKNLDPCRLVQNDSKQDKSRKMLKKYMDQAMENLFSFLDSHGMNLSVLGMAMEQFAERLVELPGDAACQSGCAYCCHLKVGVSIAEAGVIFNQLKSQATVQGLDILKQRVIQTAGQGNTLDEAFWLTTRTACPFLDTQANTCLVYGVRPFSCRAYHSIDKDVCHNSFDLGQQAQIPCYPMYRAFTDMYSTVFIKVLAQKGLFSYQVGFVKALQILFEDETVFDRWLAGEDAFRAASLA